MPQKQIYNLTELSEVLDRSPGYFRCEGRKRLEAHGFPKPLPGLCLTWSKAAVDNWIASNGEPEAPALTITYPSNITADLETAYATGRS